MQHPAEGTIHAWLDGALTVEEGHAIETHIATCDTCAAMVADARGLIAGSSRILTALDHVPSGVIPARTSAGLDGGVSVAARAGAGTPEGRRFAWTRDPLLRAAAVLLFLAGGTAVVLQQVGDDVAMTQMRQESQERAADGRAATQPVVPMSAGEERRAEDAATMPVTAAPASARGDQTAGGRIGEATSSTAAAPPPPPAVATTGAGLDSVSVMGVREQIAAKMAAPRRAAAPPAPVARDIAAGSAFSDTTMVGGLRGGSAGSGGVDSLGGIGRARDERVRIAQERVEASLVPAPRQAPGEEQRLRDTIGGIRGAAAVADLASSVAGVELSGCYTITLAPWMPAGQRGPRTPSLPPLLVLDATMLEVAVDGPRMALRLPGDTSAPSPSGSYWRLAGRDSVVIVWRATTPETTIRIGGAGGTRTGVATHDGRRSSVTAERLGDRCAY